MDDELVCYNCLTEITRWEDLEYDGQCEDCYIEFDEDKAELSFLDELIDFGGEG